MAVFRVEKTKDFTIMCNHHLRKSVRFICKTAHNLSALGSEIFFPFVIESKTPIFTPAASASLTFVRLFAFK